jgi:hypothetical protein
VAYIEYQSTTEGIDSENEYQQRSASNWLMAIPRNPTSNGLLALMVHIVLFENYADFNL